MTDPVFPDRIDPVRTVEGKRALKALADDVLEAVGEQMLAAGEAGHYRIGNIDFGEHMTGRFITLWHPDNKGLGVLAAIETSEPDGLGDKVTCYLQHRFAKPSLVRAEPDKRHILVHIAGSARFLDKPSVEAIRTEARRMLERHPRMDLESTCAP
ncbi:hypothetical protein J2T57_001492 [Natronocella acetinitrilica]|uniref:Uncharacterized protein n=1 Tax=Natronocella acetinitrilica TaxID=414046 RepID=A0AAE3KAJ2_9GAMM|nr:hypothetical protein [Natronocella acetinitrilica]MCP1674390.1 hypothetical protein [Natronocella acetinitrilica]